MCWFDAEMTPGQWLSTSPAAGPTHWKQTLLPLKEAITMIQGERLKGAISCEPLEDDHRGLKIQLTIYASDFSKEVSQSFSLR